YFEPFFGTAFGQLTESYLGDAEESRERVSDDPEAPTRGFGTFFHANPTAIHLEFLLPFALIAGLAARTWWWKGPCAILFVLGSAALYVTYSRAGLPAFLVSMLVCVVVATWRGLIRPWVFACLVALAGVGTLCLLPAFASYMRTRPEVSVSHVEHLEEGAAVFLRHPLFGVGINNSSAVREVVAADNLTNEEH